MLFYSIGTGAGSVASTAAYAAAGWTAVCLLGGTISGIALLFWAARAGNLRPRIDARPPDGRRKQS